ncbi:hypothetical protein [Clostridium intestinale]|uniref:Uncharacterized protein n=1 Tax=Clostridium intestinale DSM 6191 TaxID=1121320 RepID=A0A1M5ZW08_9CLOT|nr:hypothetical protein [Clostridium intestinale]SHI28103.1 hypothetical protein SAMN02745941_03443 [Clostridium intestinale DSM 6191]
MKVSKYRNSLIYSVVVSVTIFIINIYLIIINETVMVPLNLVLVSLFNSNLINRNTGITKREKKIILSITVINILSVFICMAIY